MVLATGPPPATESDRPLVQGLGVTTFPLLEVAVTDASALECLDRPRELLVKRVLIELRTGDETYHWLTE